MNLEELKTAMRGIGCVRLYAKTLAANDNSKNQIYLGGSVESLQMLHPHSISAANAPRGPTFKGKLDFGWLLESGRVQPAPYAQLILYSQYPEVRLSAVLLGCGAEIRSAIQPLIASRMPGRILFIGTTSAGQVIGHVEPHDSALANEYRSTTVWDTNSALKEIPLASEASPGGPSARLLAELARIHGLGWIESKQLASDGTVAACNAPQCGGYTLEAELGVAKNGRPEPDFDGWEVKSYSVSDFCRPLSGGPVTLFTPEPTGGYYGQNGYQDFVRKYGYKAKSGEHDRLNFGGIHIVDHPHNQTGLMLALSGFDASKSLITDANGSIDLVTSTGAVAASWNFSTVLEHWSRKHAAAAYVPTRRRDEPKREYCYGHTICLAQRGDPQLLLAALAAGFVYYDPGIKLLHASTPNASGKPRSQFRIKSRDLAAIYTRLDEVRLVDTQDQY